MTINECPYCRGTSGYYIKVVFTQNLFCGWKGAGDDDNCSPPKQIKGGKRKFCADCDRDVTKFINT